MTTDPATYRHRLTVFEWRLYLVAALATIYALVWRAIDRPATAVADGARAPTEAPAAPARATVWLDQLPLAQRPTITAPAGWTVIDRGAAPAPVAPTARPRVVRAPESRPRRVRTRSS